MGARTRVCAHAQLLRSPCSLGRSYRRKSAVYLLVSLVDANRRSCLRLNFCCAFGGCRVFGFAGTRKRPHAWSLAHWASLICLCVGVRACKWLSLARVRAVGLASGSRRGLAWLFRRGTWDFRGRHRSRSCARFARWGVLLDVVGRGSVLMLRAHAHTRHPLLLVFPVGAASVLSWCRMSRAWRLRCVGYARAARCGPLVASRPPGDIKYETNPH